MKEENQQASMPKHESPTLVTKEDLQKNKRKKKKKSVFALRWFDLVLAILLMIVAQIATWQ